MIYCCGEALIDLLPAKDSADGLQALTGGGPFNTAIALARLGLPAALFCPLSKDGFGARLASQLLEEGVDLSLCPRPAAPTTLAVVTLQDGKAGYAFYTEGTALCSLRPADLPQITTGLALFGGISLGLEPCGAAYEALFDACAPDVLRMVDPNIRPAVIPDAAAYRARLARMLPRADILKLSDEDLAWLTDEPEGQLQAWRTAGVALICVTLGDKGVRLIGAGEDITLPAPEVTLCDTIGAGDSFNAGLLAALQDMGLCHRAGLRGLSAAGIRAAGSFGQKVAGVTVSRAGANPPHRADLRP